MPTRVHPLRKKLMSRVPMIVPVMVPRPPDRLAPPMTTRNLGTPYSILDQISKSGMVSPNYWSLALCHDRGDLQPKLSTAKRTGGYLFRLRFLSVHRGLAMLVRLIDVAFKECQHSRMGAYFFPVSHAAAFPPKVPCAVEHTRGEHR